MDPETPGPEAQCIYPQGGLTMSRCRFCHKHKICQTDALDDRHSRCPNDPAYMAAAAERRRRKILRERMDYEALPRRYWSETMRRSYSWWKHRITPTQQQPTTLNTSRSQIHDDSNSTHTARYREQHEAPPNPSRSKPYVVLPSENWFRNDMSNVLQHPECQQMMDIEWLDGRLLPPLKAWALPAPEEHRSKVSPYLCKLNTEELYYLLVDVSWRNDRVIVACYHAALGARRGCRQKLHFTKYGLPELEEQHVKMRPFLELLVEVEMYLLLVDLSWNDKIIVDSIISAGEAAKTGGRTLWSFGKCSRQRLDTHVRRSVNCRIRKDSPNS